MSKKPKEEKLRMSGAKEDANEAKGRGNREDEKKGKSRIDYFGAKLDY